MTEHEQAKLRYLAEKCVDNMWPSHQRQVVPLLLKVTITGEYDSRLDLILECCETWDANFPKELAR